MVAISLCLFGTQAIAPLQTTVSLSGSTADLRSQADFACSRGLSQLRARIRLPNETGSQLRQPHRLQSPPHAAQNRLTLFSGKGI